MIIHIIYSRRWCELHGFKTTFVWIPDLAGMTMGKSPGLLQVQGLCE